MVSNAFSLGAIVLAAGASTRMGQPKMTLPWAQGTVLSHIINEWQFLGASQIAVVCDPKNGSTLLELDRLKFNSRIFNDDPARGMFSSILTAATWPGWNSDITHYAIILGDQPHLNRRTLTKVIEAARNTSGIVQPSHRNRPRHPVFLSSKIFQELRHSTSKTLKEFIALHHGAITLVELPDSELDLDLDYPQDYETAKKLFG
jgi:molybdenum cofactor cytidylyltransferase